MYNTMVVLAIVLGMVWTYLILPYLILTALHQLFPMLAVKFWHCLVLVLLFNSPSNKEQK